jgi:hypothetical protein
MKTNRDHRASRARIDSINGAESRSDGFKLLELLLVVAIGSLMVAVAVPIINTTMTNLHLGSAATGLSTAVQSARYLAISSGCPVQMTVSAHTYQEFAPATSGTPPACNITPYPYPALPVPYNQPITFASSEISVTSASLVSVSGTVLSSLTIPASLQFNPNGTVTATYAPGSAQPAPSNFSIVLSPSNGTARKTLFVSGVGNVKVQ